jgi:serine/threonine protein kinase
MEQLESVEKIKNSRGGLSRTQTLQLGLDICNALVSCEEKNIIHRDIKLSNIFYSEKGGYKLGDFGISRTMDSIHEKMSMSSAGTIQYMAPEVYHGYKYDSSADLYSLGIALYILLNRNLPPLCNAYNTPAGNLSISMVHEANMRRLRGEPLPPPRCTDPLLASVICAACNPDPESRFQTAGAFRQALISSMQGGRPSVPPQSRPQQPGHQQSALQPSPQPAVTPVNEYPAHGSADTGSSPAFRIFALVSIAVAAMGILLFLVVRLLTVKAPSADTDTSSPSGTPVAEQDAGADTDPDTEQEISPSQDQNAVQDTEENLTESGSQDPETGSEDSASPVEEASQDTEPASDSDPDTDMAISDAVADNPADDTESDSESDSQKEIQWSDNNLKSAVTDQVRTQLGISGAITVGDAMKVQKLDLTNSAVSDLSDLRYFVGLTSLELGNNFITDISALSNLRKLQNLNLEQNSIEDVTPLSGLTRLKELDLNENSIEDISCLSELTQLTMLDIRSNYIGDISALKNMTQMKELYMSSNNDIYDLSPLSDMPSLWYLSFKDTAVTDLSPLRRDTALTTLVMSLTNVTDISVIDNFNGLGYLDIRGCSISDYSPANRVAQRKGSTVKK